MALKAKPIAVSPLLQEKLEANITIANSGCWLWLGAKTKEGYGHFKNGKHLVAAHRAMMALCLPKLPIDLYVLHRCDVPSCVNPKHLFLGTASQNTKDAVAKGRWNKQGGANAKLDKAKVREIRMLYASGNYTQEELSIKFSVGRITIHNVVSHKLWKYA